MHQRRLATRSADSGIFTLSLGESLEQSQPVTPFLFKRRGPRSMSLEWDPASTFPPSNRPPFSIPVIIPFHYFINA